MPSKVSNMVWRALSNCLPTRVSLAQKKVHVSSLCPWCKVHNETVVHALVLCPAAQLCWSQVLPEVNGCDFEDFPQWWEEVFKVCNNDRRAEVASICWSLWKARNDLVWKNKYTRTNMVIALAK